MIDQELVNQIKARRGQASASQTGGIDMNLVNSIKARRNQPVPVEQPKQTGLRAMMAGIETGQSDKVGEIKEADATKQRLNSLIASRQLETQGVPQQGFLDRIKSGIGENIKERERLSADLRGDVMDTGKAVVSGIGDSFSKGGDRLSQSFTEASDKGLSGIFSDAGRDVAISAVMTPLKALVSAGEDLFLGAGKAVLSQDQEDAFAAKFQEITGQPMIADNLEKLDTWYQGLDQQSKNDVGDLGTIMEFVGVGRGSKAISSGLETGVEKGLDVISNVDLPGVNLPKVDMPSLPKKAPVKPEGTSVDIATSMDETSIQKLISSDKDILTRGEKISAIELDTEAGSSILTASREADLHPDNPTAIDTAVDLAFEQIDRYKAKLKETGGNIGGIKDDLLTKQMKGDSVPLSEAASELEVALGKKGVTKVDGEWVTSKTSPIEARDLKEIDDLMAGIEEIQATGSLKDVVNLIEKIDNSGIKFGETSKISQTLDGLLKKTRSKLKAIRDSNLTPDEVAEFAKYAEMRTFLDNFKDKESAVRLLLKRANTQFKGDTKKASQAIAKEIGGNRIDRIGEVLASILEGGASKSDKSRLGQLMGSETDIILGLVNPKGLVSKVAGGAIRKKLAKDRLAEIEKFIGISATKSDISQKPQTKVKPRAAKPETKSNQKLNQQSSKDIIPKDSTKAKPSAKVGGMKNLETEAKKFKTADEFVENANTTNPTGGLFVDYTPNARTKIPLGDNIQTLDMSIGGNPDDVITIYRGTTGGKINNGDFITTNDQLAKDYAGAGKVVELKVRKGDIIDMVDESGGEEYIYRVGADKEPRHTKDQLTDIWNKANKK